jgi:hypothetical protein
MAVAHRYSETFSSHEDLADATIWPGDGHHQTVINVEVMRALNEFECFGLPLRIKSSIFPLVGMDRAPGVSLRGIAFDVLS